VDSVDGGAVVTALAKVVVAPDVPRDVAAEPLAGVVAAGVVVGDEQPTTKRAHRTVPRVRRTIKL